MNAPTKPIGQFAWYMEALAGHRGDFDTRNPPSGYYRSHDRSLAVWRDDDGTLRWSVSHGFSPRHVDQLCDAFATFCMRPVSYDDWERHSQTGQWPESPEPEIAAARATTPGIGHNSGTPVEQIADELAVLETAFRDWLKSIGGAIATEAHDAKGDEFRARFAALKKRADEAHETDKRPHLDAGREVDRLWKAPRDRADAGKREVGAALTPYRRERDRLRQEAERKARQAEAQARAEAEAANRPIPAQTPVYGQPKPKTGLRTVKKLVFTDLGAFAGYLLETAPNELADAVAPLARASLMTGVATPGAKLISEKVA